MTQTIDETKLEQLMGQMVGHMTGAALCFGVWLGDELGLYRALTELGSATADELADSVGCNRRLVREWLDGQVAGGLLTWDRDADRYGITPEATMALADDELAGVRGPRDERDRLRVHRPAQDHRSVPRRRRPQLGRPPPVPVQRDRVVLPHRLPRRAPELDRGARRRRRHARRAAARSPTSVAVTARRWSCSPSRSPPRTSPGFDFHEPSIDTARERADEAGVGRPGHLRPRGREELLGHLRPDLLLRLPARHGRPGRYRALRPRAPQRRRHRPPGRAVRDRRSCRQHRRQPDGGACSTPCRRRSARRTRSPRRSGSASARRPARHSSGEVFEAAGFTQFRRAAETPLNLILEAKG